MHRRPGDPASSLLLPNLCKKLPHNWVPFVLIKPRAFPVILINPYFYSLLPEHYSSTKPEAIAHFKF